MNNTPISDWVPFGKPIKYQNLSQRSGLEGFLLAWRTYYEPQQKAFEPISIGGIEYLDTCGDIWDWEDVEFLDNPGREQ